MAMTEEQRLANNAAVKADTANLLEGLEQAEIKSENKKLENEGRGVNNPRKVHVRVRKVTPPDSVNGDAKTMTFTGTTKAEGEQAHKKDMEALNKAQQSARTYVFGGDTVRGSDEAESLLDRAKRIKEENIYGEDGSLNKDSVLGKEFYDAVNGLARGSLKSKSVLDAFTKGKITPEMAGYGEPLNVTYGDLINLYDKVMPNGVEAKSLGGLVDKDGGAGFFAKLGGYPSTKDLSETERGNALQGKTVYAMLNNLKDAYGKAWSGVKEIGEEKKDKINVEKDKYDNSIKNAVKLRLLKEPPKEVQTIAEVLGKTEKEGQFKGKPEMNFVKDLASQFATWVDKDKDRRKTIDSMKANSMNFDNYLDQVMSTTKGPFRTFLDDYLSRQTFTDSEGVNRGGMTLQDLLEKKDMSDWQNTLQKEKDKAASMEAEAAANRQERIAKWREENPEQAAAVDEIWKDLQLKSQFPNLTTSMQNSAELEKMVKEKGITLKDFEKGDKEKGTEDGKYVVPIEALRNQVADFENELKNIDGTTKEDVERIGSLSESLAEKKAKLRAYDNLQNFIANKGGAVDKDLLGLVASEYIPRAENLYAKVTKPASHYDPSLPLTEETESKSTEREFSGQRESEEEKELIKDISDVFFNDIVRKELPQYFNEADKIKHKLPQVDNDEIKKRDLTNDEKAVISARERADEMARELVYASQGVQGVQVDDNLERGGTQFSAARPIGGTNNINSSVYGGLRNYPSARKELLPSFKGYEGLKGTSAGTTSDKRMKNICEGISWGVGY